jgi:hypothetical protein
MSAFDPELSRRGANKQSRHHRVELAIDGIDGIDRFPDREKLNFLAKAWKAAHQKARAIGWASLLSYSEMPTVIKL